MLPSWTMSDHWNSETAYAFSSAKAIMWILGTWPLPTNRTWSDLRFLFFILVQVAQLSSTLTEMYINCGDVATNIHNIVAFEIAIRGIINNISLRMHTRDLTININAAARDWSHLAIDKKSHEIMKKYASKGRMVAISVTVATGFLHSCYTTGFFLQTQYFNNVPAGNDTSSEKLFFLPANCIFPNITDRQHLIVSVMQILGTYVIVSSHVAANISLYSMVMHLCGQLEILKQRFANLSRIGHKKRQDKEFGILVTRHCDLIELTRNIEISYSSLLLLHICLTCILITVTGLRSILELARNNTVEAGKNILIILYGLTGTAFQSYATDCLLTQSESLYKTIENISWHELPISAIKKLILIIMRARIPFRITAGKFFYVSRSTILDILRTSISYISVLQVLMHL